MWTQHKVTGNNQTSRKSTLFICRIKPRSYECSIEFVLLSCTIEIFEPKCFQCRSFCSDELDLLGLCDSIGHVTIQSANY